MIFICPDFHTNISNSMCFATTNERFTISNYSAFSLAAEVGEENHRKCYCVASTGSFWSFLSPWAGCAVSNSLKVETTHPHNITIDFQGQSPARGGHWSKMRAKLEVAVNGVWCRTLVILPLLLAWIVTAVLWGGFICPHHKTLLVASFLPFGIPFFQNKAWIKRLGM